MSGSPALRQVPIATTLIIPFLASFGNEIFFSDKNSFGASTGDLCSLSHDTAGVNREKAKWVETAPALNLSPESPPELWEQVSVDLTAEFRDVSHHLVPEHVKTASKLRQARNPAGYPSHPRQRSLGSPQQHQHSKVKGVSNKKLHFWALFIDPLKLRLLQ